MKVVSLSQVSSTLITRCVGGEEKQPDSNSGIILMANCCRSTRHFSWLLCIGTVLASRYPIRISFLITCVTSLSATLMPFCSRTASRTNRALVIGVLAVSM